MEEAAPCRIASLLWIFAANISISKQCYIFSPSCRHLYGGFLLHKFSSCSHSERFYTKLLLLLFVCLFVNVHQKSMRVSPRVAVLHLTPCKLISFQIISPHLLPNFSPNRQTERASNWDVWSKQRKMFLLLTCSKNKTINRIWKWFRTKNRETMSRKTWVYSSRNCCFVVYWFVLVHDCGWSSGKITFCTFRLAEHLWLKS